MMKKVFAIVLLLVAVNTVFGQLSRDLDAFTKLEVTDKINVTLIPSAFDKIVIEGELANQMELVQVSEVLRLKMTGSYFMKGDKVDVTLYSSKIAHIVSRKGARVIQTAGALQGTTVSLTANEGGLIDVVFHADNIKAVASKGGAIELKGKGKTEDIDVSFGGSFQAQNFTAERAVVRVSGGGKVVINVNKMVDAETRAGGIIDVYGNPEERKQRKLAGGKINYL